MIAGQASTDQVGVNSSSKLNESKLGDLKNITNKNPTILMKKLKSKTMIYCTLYHIAKYGCIETNRIPVNQLSNRGYTTNCRCKTA